MPSLSTHRRTFFEKGAVAVGAASLGGSLLEVGGTSLHPTLAQKVTNLELLRILAEHRPQRNQAFRDLAGQSRQRLCPSPLPALVSPGSTGATVSFADLTKAQGETNLESLNMPEPCHFLDPTLGPVAIIRKTSAKLSAGAAIRGFVDDGLFIGQKDPAFLNMVFQLAEEADAARREL